VRTLQDEQRQVLSEIITLRVEMKQTLIDNEAKSKAVLLDGLTEWLEKLKPSLIG
jgi:adenosyl cobinamide kinase/adenosyl cobinamide phosphate guanylyltransferase